MTTVTNFTMTQATSKNPATQKSETTNLASPRGRLLFALDATGSRAETWVTARDLQAELFRSSAPVGKLAVQLCFFRGDECRASPWLGSGDEIVRMMNRIECKSGLTQIGRVLTHALKEAAKAPIQTVIFVGDAQEEELEELGTLAAKLGRLKTPLYMFQEIHEGEDPTPVRKAYKLLALKSGGKYFTFDRKNIRAKQQLAEQFAAIARHTVGDGEALLRLTGR